VESVGLRVKVTLRALEVLGVNEPGLRVEVMGRDTLRVGVTLPEGDKDPVLVRVGRLVVLIVLVLLGVCVCESVDAAVQLLLSVQLQVTVVKMLTVLVKEVLKEGTHEGLPEGEQVRDNDVRVSENPDLV